MSEIRTWLLHCQVAQPCCACISVGRQDNLREVLVLDPHGGEDDGGDPVAPVQELLHQGSKKEKVALGAKAMEDKDVMGLDEARLGSQEEGEKEEEHGSTLTFQPYLTTVSLALNKEGWLKSKSEKGPDEPLGV